MQASPDSREFYVYVIFRPDGRPCYVGKGKGGRWEVHFRNARNKHLSNIISKAGGNVPVVKVREHLTNEEAIATEIAWIAALGRKKDGGPLVNLTDGGEGTTGLFVSLETRARMSEASKAMWQDPNYKARISEATKAQWESPEARARLSEARKAQWESPETRARMSEAAKAALANPEVRARMSEAAKARLASPETRARMSEAAKAQWESPQARARKAEAAKAQWESPEARARMSEARKAMWQDPAYRAQVLATRAKNAALKKAAKEAAD
jgi:hypothetical protein